MKQDQLDKLVKDTISSFDGAKRAEVKPYLLTRVNARISSMDSEGGFWSWTTGILSRPGIAFTGLLVILIVNIVIILNNTRPGNDSTQNLSSAKDEFAITQVSVYDVENQEP